MTISKTQDRLSKIAAFASSHGYQVTHSWTPQDKLGRSLRSITISGYDDFDYAEGAPVTE